MKHDQIIKPRLQRSVGGASIAVALRDGRTRLADLYQHDPCRILFPHDEPGEPFGAVLVTTSGGIAGGDRLDLGAAWGPGTAAQITTQAAEKVYRSTGDTAFVSQTLTVGAGAWAEWLPQETILFDGARLARETAVDVAAGGRLLAAELVVLGRAARGEGFTYGLWQDAWRVRRDGRPVWLDRARLDRDHQRTAKAAAGLNGAAAFATILYVADDAAERLELARELLGDDPRAGATVVNGVLVIRLMHEGAQSLRRAVGAFWMGFRNAAAGFEPRLPRVWHT